MAETMADRELDEVVARELYPDWTAWWRDPRWDVLFGSIDDTYEGNETPSWSTDIGAALRDLWPELVKAGWVLGSCGNLGAGLERMRFFIRRSGANRYASDPEALATCIAKAWIARKKGEADA